MAYKNYEDHKRNVRERLAALTPEELASRNQKKREWRERNRERLKAKDRAYYLANREKHLARTKANAPKHRLKNRLKKFGITPEDYAALQTLQRNRCAICRTDSPNGRGRWHVDHCHETGRVRGLLCGTCNTGIGHLKDDPNLLRRAALYLERHGK